MIFLCNCCYGAAESVALTRGDVEWQGASAGRQVILATGRIIPFVEAWNRPRSFDYDVSLIEIELDENDEGAGVAAVGVRFFVDTGKLTIENFGTQPVNLSAIRRTN